MKHHTGPKYRTLFYKKYSVDNSTTTASTKCSGLTRPSTWTAWPCNKGYVNSIGCRSTHGFCTNSVYWCMMYTSATLHSTSESLHVVLPQNDLAYICRWRQTTWNQDCLLNSENGHFLLPVCTPGTNCHNNSVPFQILLLLRNTSKLTFYILFLTNFSLVFLTFVLRSALFYCISAHYKFECW